MQTKAQATRVLFDGTRATGVEYRVGRDLRTASGGRVILSGGAINSPQLLMLSGIGPAGVLRPAGIEPEHELPGVGQNLQDHLEVYFQMAASQPIILSFLEGVKGVIKKNSSFCSWGSLRIMKYGSIF